MVSFDFVARFAKRLRTAVDVNAVLEAVDGVDLALTSLVGTTDNLDLILRKVSTP